MAHPGSTAHAAGRTSITSVIYEDACQRLQLVLATISTPLVALSSLLPRAANALPVPASDLSAFDPSNSTLVEGDVEFLTSPFHFWRYKGEVDWIRAAPSLDQCLTRLSMVLSSEGPLRSGETGGTAGALSLLPTAGALIGAPAKELWVVYKLMPLAGFLSMLLSLGGNIVPSQSNDYALTPKAFNYGGFISTSKTDGEEAPETENVAIGGTPAQKFAHQVKSRADDFRGSQKRTTIAGGIVLQLCWIAVILGACWFVQIGSVIVWWCQAWGWMMFWYLAVAMSSILENIAGVPFTKQWTIRVSKAPDVTISSDAPLVAQGTALPKVPRTTVIPKQDELSSIMPEDARRSSLDIYPMQRLGSFTPLSSRTTQDDLGEQKQPLTKSFTNATILANLERGFNTTGTVVVDPLKAHSRALVPFYVIISLEGVSTAHATLRVISKAISVGTFAAGTAIFASSTLTTISVGLTVLCLVLGAGVFGRVVSMWMASELMKDNPILHKIVHSNGEAAEYMDEVLSLPGITFEVMGHIIVQGRCIHRYNKFLNFATIFGILAEPFDITELARPLRKISTE